MRHEKVKKKINIGKILGIVFTTILFFILSLACTSMIWCMDVWREITASEIVFHLTAPLTGTSTDVLSDFFVRALAPAVILAIVYFVARLILRYKDRLKALKITTIAVWAVLVLALLITGFRFCMRYGVIKYIVSQTMESDFIGDNYVSADDVKITFPEKKRNLVYIYLESMEDTYSDRAHGGAFDYDCIPELTELAMDNQCFAGDSGYLNGGRVTTGTDFTMAALVAQTAGIPINGGIGNAATSFADSFYPGAVVLGDVLADAGYNQMFMCGSVAYFGGRELYFRSHGDYTIFDQTYAEEHDFIPKGYNVWWGYEDEKLFDFAKQMILEMASEEEPFNFTMLTADTHFEDGYLCPLCQDEFDDQYANVMACSSRQVYAFVEWLKQQPFYEDTTIIISGDHLTMDSDFCKSIDTDYVRTNYFCIINPAKEPETNDRREYTTLDIYPTTLSSMGCDIQGDRLGLGTDLFSSSPTLIEQYGFDLIDTELAKKSTFYDTIGQFDPLSAGIMKRLRYMDVECSLDPDNSLNISFWGIENGNLVIDSVRGEFYSPSGELIASGDFCLSRDKVYSLSLDLGDTPARDVFTGTLKIFATDSEGTEHLVYINDDNTSALKYDSIEDYMEVLSSMEDMTVFIAVRDEASLNLTEEIRDSFGLLGLECTVFDKFHNSYVGIVGDGIHIEDTSEMMLNYQGTLPDGHEYEVTSAGFDAGNCCSIEIDDTDYALNRRGFNIVTYDNLTSRVVDTVYYDLYLKSVTSIMSDETVNIDYDYDEAQGTLDVTITGDRKAILTGKNLYVYMYVWSPEDPKENRKVVFTRETDSEGSEYYVLKDLDLNGYDPGEVGMMFFFKSQDTGLIDYKIKVMTDLLQQEG